MSETNNGTATATEPAPKTAGQLLKEVQSEGGAKEKAAPGKAPKGKKAAKEKAAPAAEPKAEEASKTAPTRDPLAPVEWTPITSPVSELMEDRRLQHRKDMQDVSEGGAVEQYAEAYKAGKKLPPLRFVLDVSDTKEKGTKWLIDGYQRKGALKAAKMKEAECEYVEGNFADALILSLSANSENSVIARTKDDARRSVFALLDNKDALAAALAKAKGNGGAIKVFSDLCGVSAGTVSNALAARGKKAKNDTLVDVPPVKNPPKAKKTETPATPPAPPAAPLSPEDQKKLDAEAFERLKAREVLDLSAEMKKNVRGIAARMGALLVNPKYAEGVKEELDNQGFGVDPEFFRRKNIDGDKFAPHYEMLELWPLVETLTKLLDGVERTVQAMQEAEADAEKAKTIPGTV